jgi:parallel beta-helix repeat protein
MLSKTLVLHCILLLLLGLFVNVYSQEAEWKNVTPYDPYESPAPRVVHNIVYDTERNEAVLFGGYSYTLRRCLSDTWVWDGTNWIDKTPPDVENLIATGQWPGPRARHAMVFDNVRGVSVLFGGACSGSLLGDTWAWDGTSWTEKAIEGVPGLDKPGPRFCRAAAFDNQRGVMVLFGGYYNGTYLKDLWEWNGTNWSDRTPTDVDYLIATDQWPEPRIESGMVFDQANRFCVLYGGELPYWPWRMDDTWLWDGNDWTFGGFSGEPRHAFAIAYDSHKQVVVRFGGNDQGTNWLDCTWEGYWNGLDFVWEQRYPVNNPSGRRSAMTYDSDRKVVILFGGDVSFLQDDDETWTYGIPCIDDEIVATDTAGEQHYYPTIQAAVDDAGAGWVITVGSGTYPELVNMDGKSGLTIKTECGAVVQGFHFKQSDNITIDGFVIDASGSSEHGVTLMGGINDNESVTIANCEIFGADNDYSGISVARGNPNFTVSNCRIHDNGRNGVLFIDATGGPHFLTGNTIEANGWNGVRVARQHEITLTGNIISNNGTKPGTTGGRYGLLRERVTGTGLPEGITLIDNAILNNKGPIVSGKSSLDLGNYDQILDETDNGNTTTSNDEGPGVG